MKIGIAAKLSKVEWDMYRLSLSKEEVIESYIQQEKDVKKILKSHEKQKRNIEYFLDKIPDAKRIDIIALEEGKASKPEIDMLFAMGGDNFFQICSHYFPEAYFVGVNTDPRNKPGQTSGSLGALLYFDSESLQKNLDKILNGEFETEHWTRVATSLNGQRIEDATCTVSLSIKATDMMSRYLLKLNEEQEEQKATGILVASGAGSGKNAWYRNAGIYLPMVESMRYPETTQEFPKTSKQLKTLTREPMGGADCRYRWLNHTVKENEELSLIYWANDPSELSIDSINRYDVNDGDRLTFRVSKNPLKVVNFR